MSSHFHKINISVIIPVFNAAKYVSKCIQSVLNQSLPEIEIIIINDGSTDGSKSIIQSFAERDNRIVFVDCQNEGVSSARNKGIHIAKGEFIGFVDADDWIEPAMYETMFTKAVETNSDLAICNVNQVSATKADRVRLALDNRVLNITENIEEEIVNLMRFKYDYANWNKIYKAQIIKQNHLYFAEQMTVYEDLLFNLYYFQYSQKAVMVNEAMYHYRIHPDSVMNLNKHDVVNEYNLLFTGFNTFCNEHAFNEGKERFNEEMRRGFYYALLPKLVKQIKEEVVSGRKRIKLLALELRKAEMGLFNYSFDELKGVQGFKKQLLKKEKFSFFSFLKFINS